MFHQLIARWIDLRRHEGRGVAPQGGEESQKGRGVLVDTRVQEPDDVQDPDV